jgi:hypothetical protein
VLLEPLPPLPGVVTDFLCFQLSGVPKDFVKVTDASMGTARRRRLLQAGGDPADVGPEEGILPESDLPPAGAPPAGGGSAPATPATAGSAATPAAGEAAGGGAAAGATPTAAPGAAASAPAAAATGGEALLVSGSFP